MLNWDVEPWVKLYTRESEDDYILSYEARFVFYELLRRVDRDGVLETKRVESLAARLRAPADVVQRGVTELMAEGRVVPCDSGLRLTNFVEAQKKRDSNRERQQRFRDKRKAACGENAAEEIQDLKKRERDPDRNVTRVTRNVTSNLSLSSDPECPERAQPVPAPSVDNSPEEDLLGVECLTTPQRERLARHREEATRLWRLQAALREEVARHLGLSIAEVPMSARALWPIVERLAESTPEQCEMALHYYASEARKKQTLQYFNGQTNWRPEHVQRACSLARLPAKSKPKPPPVVVRDEERAPPEVMAAALEFARAL